MIPQLSAAERLEALHLGVAEIDRQDGAIAKMLAHGGDPVTDDDRKWHAKQAKRRAELSQLRQFLFAVNESPPVPSVAILAPECYKHPGTRMVYADGTQMHHDKREPHWRCELWVGSGVCGAIKSITPQ